MFCTIGTHQEIQAVLTPIGASLVSLLVPDSSGTRHDVVLGLEDEKDYHDNPFFFGGTVGRYANRIAGASFSLDGKTFALDANDGTNSLHGGSDSWHTRTWRVLEQSDDRVVFALTSPDGDQGCPGTLEVTATYAIAGSTLSLVYEATSDAPTICCLTNHSYFNLNGHGSGSIMDHRLAFDAQRFLPVSDALIPTGELAPVAGTAWDFRVERPISEGAPAGGYDHCFILGDHEGVIHAAHLVGDKTGISMDISTNQPGIQLYTGNFIDNAPGKEGCTYGYQSGMGLEPEILPDAIHHPAWPSPVLQPGQTYRWETRYSFGCC